MFPEANSVLMKNALFKKKDVKTVQVNADTKGGKHPAVVAALVGLSSLFTPNGDKKGGK